MTYIVEAFIDGHWTHLLATRDHATAKWYKRGIKGLKTRITALATRRK